MSRNPYAARRPGGVTFVVLLTLVIGFVSLVRGFLGLFGVESAITPTDLTGTAGTVYGWGELVLGIATIAVGLGLASGSNLARFLVTALMVLRIIAAIWTAFTFAGQGGILVSALIGGTAVIVLLLLWNLRADRFFLEN